MTTRAVSVKLAMEVGGYVQGAKQAAKATRDLGSEIAKEAEKNRAAWTEVGQGLLAVGALAGVGLGLAVKKFADFDQAMSAVSAATRESAEGMKVLRDAALEAGARTAFSATEAAGAIEQLAKAGVSTADILGGGLNGALDLAAAGSLDVGEAAEIAATAMVQFGLSGAKVPHIADLLAAAAGKAQGEVTDMAAALKQSGLVASQMGLSVEETTGTLAAFASAGLLGSDAGTSFRTMLLRLTNPSNEAAQTMKRLGINVYDATGQFVGMEGLAGQLTTRMRNLDPATRNAALATIFGSDAIRAANVLYTQGAEGIGRWTDEVNDAGFAADQAARLMDNWKGDLEQLGGSIETALIKNGSAANGVLREMTQLATGAVNAYGALPGPIQGVATGALALTAAVGLAGGAFLIAVPKVVAFRTALGEMGPTTQRVAGKFGGLASALGGPLGIALAAGTLALGLYAIKRAEAQAAVEEFTTAIKADSGAVGENARELATNRLEANGVYQSAQQLGLGLDLVTEAALGNTDAMAKIEKQLRDGNIVVGNDFFNNISEVAEATRQGTEAANRQTEGFGDQADASATSAEAQAALAVETESATSAMKEQADMLRAQFDPVFAMNQALVAQKQAQDDLAAAIKEHGAESGEATQAEIALLDATVGLSGASLDLSDSVNEGTTSTAAMKQQLDRWREAGLLTEGQARNLAGQLDTLTGRADELDGTVIDVTVADNAAAAEERLRNLRGLAAALDGTVVGMRVLITQQGSLTARTPGVAGALTERADGGWIGGNGGPRADDQLIRASTGEFVVNSASASRHAALLEAINGNRFASGGWVSGRSGGSTSPVNVAAPRVSVTFADGMGWLKQFVQVEVDGTLEAVGSGVSAGYVG